MIFKVYYQETAQEYPIRERTKSLFIEADSVREVRQTLSERGYNIEYIQQIDEIHLAFEKKSPNFKVESV
ncbi:MAG TPA: DNA-directed RNA polymerase subunit epsilon [Bacillota bacterium]|nr:DNA-directed RNA polymerase subunit epsilon [Bacillota bacterium]